MTKLQGMAVALCLTAGSLPVAQAEVLDLNLNDKAVQGQFSGPLGNMFEGAAGEYQLGGLYSDQKNYNFTTLNGGFLLSGDTGAQDVKLNAGVGLRGEYSELKHVPVSGSNSGGGAALGGQFDVRFAGFDRLGLTGDFWYQPKVLSLGDLEGQYEWALDAEYQILRNASIYAGYRKVRVNLDNTGTFTTDDGAHLGIRFKF